MQSCKNQNQRNHNNKSELRKISQRANEDLKSKQTKCSSAGKLNVGDQVVIGCSFVLDRSRTKRELSGPII